MVCYKDKTFCTFDTCIEFFKCRLALTTKVRNKAKIWWDRKDEEAPIMVFIDKPSCFKEKK